MTIFKAYDIRGTYPDQIDADAAQRIGHAFARHIGRGAVVVGHDMRTMAGEIHAACIDGIRAAGLDVIDIGLASTPQTYFATASLEASGGIAITASHNPAGYTGFKMTREQAIPISADSGLKAIEALSAEPVARAARPGGLRSVDTLTDYASHVCRWADLARPVRIASDAANGMAAHTFPRILEALPDIEHHGLYYELDGTFPNHEANPLKQSNLRDLQALVGRTGAELGAAFDGDADRCCFVDDRGRALGNDIITALVAERVLAEEPGAAIVYDLRSSWILPKTVLAAGGRPEKERVGHSFLKARMRACNAPFGGELSGHYYFRDNWFADNSEIILLCVLGILSRSERSLAEHADQLLQFHSTGEVNFEVDDKQAAIERLRQAFPRARTDMLDGITLATGEVDDADWWWVNVRPSNTEPLLRMTLEARTPERMQQMQARVIEIIGVDPQD
ncbi:MAG: phosphomannomutase/phosphoglucomutase [Gammaproteobacteria bacterium]|nr:phosphomannomutase/phosphoglucomutase [Gammaproteobacteria bacterium]